MKNNPLKFLSFQKKLNCKTYSISLVPKLSDNHLIQIDVPPRNHKHISIELHQQRSKFKILIHTI
jgi:hypothetical protein